MAGIACSRLLLVPEAEGYSNCLVMGCWFKLKETIPQPEHLESVVSDFYGLEQHAPGSQGLSCSLWLCQSSSCASGTQGWDCQHCRVSPHPHRVLSSEEGPQAAD